MRFDQLNRFAKCLVNNGDGTFSVQTTNGATGSNFASSKYSDTMKAFDKTIQSNAVRITSG